MPPTVEQPGEQPDLIGPWRKSTYTNQGDCFEFAATTHGVALRNSNDHSQGVLHFTPAEFAAWIRGCKAGEFDDLL
jgi:hypothetical protein